jgi:hypothetical protein
VALWALFGGVALIAAVMFGCDLKLAPATPRPIRDCAQLELGRN